MTRNTSRLFCATFSCARRLGENTRLSSVNASMSGLGTSRGPRRIAPSSAPPVTAWGLDQPRAHGVEFNVPRGGQQIRLIEHE
jgi:hypothetical protein